MRRLIRETRGISMLELVASTAIVSTLAIVTVGTVMEARTHSAKVKCLSRLKSLHLCFVMYADDHQGLLPQSIGGRWVDDLVGVHPGDPNYLGPGAQDVLRCPDDPSPLWRCGYEVSYAGNCWLHKAYLAGIDRPHTRMLLGDMGDDIHGLSVHCARCGENFGELGFRHGNKKANFLFPDGRAESVKYKKVTDLMWADDTTFPNNCPSD